MIKCRFENGSGTSLRHVTVSVILLNRTRDKVLLVKRSPHLTNPNKWAFPGGFLDRGETTKEAALREVREETGCRAKIIFLLMINDDPNRPKEDRQNVDFIYVAEAGKKTSHKTEEVSEIKWFDLNNLPNSQEFAFDHYEDLQLYKKLKTPLDVLIN